MGHIDLVRFERLNEVKWSTRVSIIVSGLLSVQQIAWETILARLREVWWKE
jgi:hypothetical protein